MRLLYPQQNTCMQQDSSAVGSDGGLAVARGQTIEMRSSLRVKAEHSIAYLSSYV